MQARLNEVTHRITEMKAPRERIRALRRALENRNRQVLKAAELADTLAQALAAATEAF